MNSFKKLVVLFIIIEILQIVCSNYEDDDTHTSLLRYSNDLAHDGDLSVTPDTAEFGVIDTSDIQFIDDDSKSEEKEEEEEKGKKHKGRKTMKKLSKLLKNHG